VRLELTAPSGKTVEFPLKEGNGVDRSYNLTAMFPELKGEKANGTWTLNVFPGDTAAGTFNSWTAHARAFLVVALARRSSADMPPPRGSASLRKMPGEQRGSAR
jgi:hypothetical protein